MEVFLSGSRIVSGLAQNSLQDCEDGKRVGIVALAGKLSNICCVQGILSGRIQTIFCSRNGHSFDEMAEIPLEAESAIFSKNERYRQGTVIGKLMCTNCWKRRYVVEKCYLTL
jgi:hypothetical protein